MLVHALLAARRDARLRTFRRALASNGALLTRLSQPADLWPALHREDFDFVVADRAFLGERPAEQVAAIRALPQRPEVLVVVDRADALEPAGLVGAGCLAVFDLDLPLAAVADSLGALLRRRREESARRIVAETLLDRNRLRDFASASPSMNRLLATARRVARADSSLLVLGETGVGKEWLARAIHAESARSEGPFVAVNCAAVPETLLESELFGHEKGAFTGSVRARRGHFELAHGGTLFLDEVAEAPPHIQAKLLRVLQDRRIQRIGAERELEVDVRLVAATNRDPAAEIAAARLRPDLYYRLSVVVLRLPPLRERREDIPVLARSYLERFRRRLGREIEAVDDAALDALLRYDWPGNVRELINVMERAVLLCSGPRVGLADLPDEIARAAGPPPRASAAPTTGATRPLREARRDVVTAFERAYLAEALRAAGGRVGEAAQRAGITSRALYTKMRQLGLDKDDFRYRPASPS